MTHRLASSNVLAKTPGEDSRIRAANHPDLTDSYGEAEKVMLQMGTVRQAAWQKAGAA